MTLTITYHFHAQLVTGTITEPVALAKSLPEEMMLAEWALPLIP